jgi:deoxyribonucleoside regulator
MKKNQPQISLLVEVARLYYEYNFGQQKIAKKLNISRPGISRLLQKARDQGIVRIEIHDPAQRGTELENELKTQFNLMKAIVAPTGNDNIQTKQILGKTAAKYLDTLIEDGLILGISWGTTMQTVITHLPPRKVKEMTIVQLNGGVSKAEYNTHASEVAQKMGEHYQAIPFLLPLPAVVDNSNLKKAILSEKNISRTLDLANRSKIAMFTVGEFDRNSVLVKADYFEENEVELLLKRRAVGDICSRIINENGNICWPELDARTISIELSELHKKQYSIAVAGGKKKLKAIYAALKGKYFNVLITDELIAEDLLNMQKKGK